MKEQNKEFFDDKYYLRRIFLNVNNLILQYNFKLNNKHDFKLIFRWDESIKMRETNLIKKICILKKMNKACLNEIYIENRLKRFKIRKIRVENIEEKRLIWRNL